jgi:Na+/proline symporter
MHGDIKVVEIGIVLVYLAVCLAIGFIYARKATSSEEQYWVGGRFLAKTGGALAIFAVVGSASTIMGSAGIAYSRGLPVAAAICAGFAVQFPLIAYITARPLLERNICTLGDYFKETIGGRHVLWAYSILTLVFMAAYIVPNLKASGIVGQWLMGENFDYATVVLVMGVTFLAYTSIGGMWAVTITDIIQGAIMVAGVGILGGVILIQPGGYTELVQRAIAAAPNITQMGMPAISVLGLAMIWGLWGLVAPTTVMRVLTMDSNQSARRALMLGSIFAAFTIGIAMLAAMAGADLKVTLAHPDMIFIVVMEKYLPPLFCGILVAAIFSAIMSSVSAFLMSCSATVARDIYKHMMNPAASEKKVILIGALMTWVVGLLTIFISMGDLPLISVLAGLAAGGLIGAFLCPILLGLYWDKLSRNGVFWGMVSGFLTYVLLNRFKIVPPLSELIFAIPVSFVFTYGVSLLSPDKKGDALQDEPL